MSSISPSRRMRSHSRTERAGAGDEPPHSTARTPLPRQRAGVAFRPAKHGAERIGQSANLGHCNGWSMRCEPTYVGAHVVPHL